LEEAIDDRNPLLENCKFAAIFASNLDAFFMVRVSRLFDHVAAGFNLPDNKSGLTPSEQLLAISEKTHQLMKTHDDIFLQHLTPLLEKEGVTFVRMDKLTDGEDLSYLKEYFDEYIFPTLTPLAIDAYRPFPMLSNKSLNLFVVLGDHENANNISSIRTKLAIVGVPSVLKRYIELPTKAAQRRFVLIEDVISFFIKSLFNGFNVESVTAFRITRNSNLTVDEEDTEDLLLEMEEVLKARKRGATVRLEIQSTSYNQKIVDYLVEELEMMDKEVYFIQAPLDLTFLFAFYKMLTESHHHLMYEPYTPQIPAELIRKNSIFEAALEQDLFFHHPYDSFQPIVDFISQAADDPDVIAIKQTLYRVSGDSPIMKALERAAENGKEVTVLVELKARFDEQNNVEWAKELENAGCHVIYGINHLKTHSKIALVVRQKKDHIERFVHLGTGNYNDSTAKTYSDMGLITSDEKFGIDATNYFNYLSGHMAKSEYHHLIVSPSDIRDEYMKLVDNEISVHQQFGDGHIIAKMNSLTDKKLIMKFYEASMAGVKVDLIIRGICCLKPGIEGFSENIKVRSIVGRFLEHTRIYYFHQHGQQKVYLSSADLMTRNMDRRIEILFPIFSNPIKEKITQCLDTILNDNVKARELNSNGQYHYVKRQHNEVEINSQHIFCEQAHQQLESVEKRKNEKTSSIKKFLLKIFKR
jgi:polyphosphate kinase